MPFWVILNFHLFLYNFLIFRIFRIFHFFFILVFFFNNVCQAQTSAVDVIIWSGLIWILKIFLFSGFLENLIKQSDKFSLGLLFWHTFEFIPSVPHYHFFILVKFWLVFIVIAIFALCNQTCQFEAFFLTDLGRFNMLCFHDLNISFKMLLKSFLVLDAKTLVVLFCSQTIVSRQKSVILVWQKIKFWVQIVKWGREILKLACEQI